MENTDEQHPVTADDLMTIYENNGYKANRNTIRDDIAALQEQGVDVIIDQKGKYKTFYIGGRLFELAEIKTLVDAVSSSRFITTEKSDALIESSTFYSWVFQFRGDINAQVLVNANALALHKIFTERIHLLSKNEGGRHTPIFDHYYPYFRFETSEFRGIMSFDQNNAIEMLMPGCDADVKVELDDYAIIAPGMSLVWTRETIR